MVTCLPDGHALQGQQQWMLPQMLLGTDFTQRSSSQRKVGGLLLQALQVRDQYIQLSEDYATLEASSRMEIESLRQELQATRHALEAQRQKIGILGSKSNQRWRDRLLACQCLSTWWGHAKAARHQKALDTKLEKQKVLERKGVKVDMEGKFKKRWLCYSCWKAWSGPLLARRKNPESHIHGERFRFCYSPGVHSTSLPSSPGVLGSFKANGGSKVYSQISIPLERILDHQSLWSQLFMLQQF